MTSPMIAYYLFRSCGVDSSDYEPSGPQLGEPPSHMEVSGSLLSLAPLEGPAVAFTLVSSQQLSRQSSAVARTGRDFVGWLGWRQIFFCQIRSLLVTNNHSYGQFVKKCNSDDRPRHLLTRNVRTNKEFPAFQKLLVNLTISHYI